MQKTFNKDNIVDGLYALYHADCSDGFGSAFCIWYYFRDNDHADKIEYIPCRHSSTVELDVDYVNRFVGKNVIMCDFSYKYDQLMQIINVANSFMILDHHKTAEQDLKNIPSELKIFDMSRSGVGITWDYFFPNKNLPQFLAHIQDRDLWTYKIPNTNEFSTYLFEQKFTFELFESFLEDDVLAHAIESGTKWLEYKKILVNKTAKHAFQKIQKINDKLMIVLYVSGAGEFASDVGNKMFTYYPLGDFSACVSHNAQEMNSRFSLRSTDDRQDVTVIAKHFGGGGHRNASGCAIPGIVLFLPFEGDLDNEILWVLKNKKLGPTVYVPGNMPIEEVVEIIKEEQLTNKQTDKIPIEYEYTLLQAEKFNNIWLREDYLDLIKRKTSNSRFIAFQTPSEKINYDIENQKIIPMNDYWFIFNEKNLSSSLDKFKFSVFSSESALMNFTSDKKFEDIFKSFMGIDTKFKVEHIEMSSEESGEDDDST